METRILIALTALLLTACQGSWIPKLPLGPLRPYQMDIQQGNVVTQDMMAKVQPGMNRSQVRFALGTPLVTDVFHPDRWDYVYLYQKAGVVTERRKIVVIFNGDKLVRIDGDVVAAPAGPVPAKGGKPEKPPAAAPAAPPAEKPATDGDQARPPWPN